MTTMADTNGSCIGLIADSHGNLNATVEAIRLLKGRGADMLVHLGDFCDSLRLSRTSAMITILRENGVFAVKGNNDFLIENMLADERRDPDPAGNSALAFLRTVPVTRTLDELLFAHSLPFDSLRSFYEPIDTGNTQRAMRLFSEAKFQLLFCGHSHLPILFRKAGGRVTREQVLPGEKIPLHNGGSAPADCAELRYIKEPRSDADRFIIIVGAADDKECALYDRDAGIYERIRIGVST
jgi:predicted phosphodiesterase